MIHSDRFKPDPHVTGFLAVAASSHNIRPVVVYYSKVLALREILHHHAFTGFVDLSDVECMNLLEKAENLFTEISNWRTAFQHSLTYYTVDVPISTTSEPPFPLLASREVWSVYPALWKSNVWNAYRVAHILVSSMCITLCDQAQIRYDGFVPSCIQEQHRANIRQMSDDILSGVFCVLWPDMFDCSGRFDPEDLTLLKENFMNPSSSYPSPSSESPLGSDFSSPPVKLAPLHLPPDWQAIGPPKQGNALAAIWPLHLVGTSKYVPIELRRYALEALRYIGANGLKVANVLGSQSFENIAPDDTEVQCNGSGLRVF